MTSADELVARITGRDWGDAKRAVAAALERTDADSVLSAALDALPMLIAPKIASALGNLHGEAGNAALRRALDATGRGSADVRAVSAMALAKRCGAEVTPLLGRLARDPRVDSYALHSLAAVGDDRAWDAVYEIVPRLARRKIELAPDSYCVLAFAYLGRHVTNDEARRVALVQRIRSIWDVLVPDDHLWISEYWPQAAPDGPEPALVPPPDAARLTAWAHRYPFVVGSPAGREGG